MAMTNVEKQRAYRERQKKRLCTMTKKQKERYIKEVEKYCNKRRAAQGKDFCQADYIAGASICLINENGGLDMPVSWYIKTMRGEEI